MATLNMRLDEALDRRLAREAQLEDQSRSELARRALIAYLSERERQRFYSEIARAARDRGDNVAVAMAEEALVAGNEALDIAEGAVAEPKGRYRVRQKRR